jgi:DNA-binding response OmpR family regulator
MERGRLLIVDDDPGIRDSLSRALGFEGYEVSVAADGDQALGMIETARYDAIVLDVMLPGTRRVFRADREIHLTKTEFDLLELLMFNAGIVLERDLILERIWGFDFETSSNSLDVYIGYLRRKIETDGAPRLIHTVRGVGYVARAE